MKNTDHQKDAKTKHGNFFATSNAIIINEAGKVLLTRRGSDRNHNPLK